MTEVDSLDTLRMELARVQSLRLPEVRCCLSPGFAARVNEGVLQRAFDGALTMAQGRTWQMKRLRGGGAVLLSRLTWRDSLRMLDGVLPVPDLAAEVAAEAVQRDGDPVRRFCFLYAVVCHGVRYIHTAPGRVGYARLVGASGVLTTGQGNCQGFADVVHLLARLAGLEAGIALGSGERALHAWNTLRIGGETYLSDASRGSRSLRSEGTQAMLRTCLMDQNGAPVRPEPQCIQEISASACDFFHKLGRKSENPPF